ncbi:heat shock protein DnaJ with tetratricopeptide repeat-containing protein [Actinidia rufa]|uniref:Heat shock protein DnaJ with tetratricopeptide repeat-containing protein n=1 Tax=Actinidia rufa TaxID=165716 RepID=A0A7J0H2S2_9ERIC|nr:heat shock protein DnaJ with tetratricopeptide repeat-containing protein [Actinidia rufa]
MYFNKVEAIREKEVAEKMINSKDYVSARDKLLKAQQLFPTLDHIVAMLTVSDILSASKTAIPGYDVDCYWVLHLMPSSSVSDINCRYQKLLNLLKPIKNKFPGTELALKLIEDAFSVLSDPEKRSEFDLKRETSWAGYESVNIQAALSQSISNMETGNAAQISSGYGRFSSVEDLERKNGVVLPTEMLQERERDLGAELQANHKTDNQHASISLQELSACSSNVNSGGSTVDEIDMPVDNREFFCCNVVARLDQDFYNFGNDRNLEIFEIGQIWAAHYQSEEPQKLSIRPNKRHLPVGCGSFCLDSENSEKVSCPTVFSHNCSWVRGVTEEQFEIYPKKGEIWVLYEDWDLDEWSYNPEIIKGCKFRFVEMLSDFSKYLGADGVYLVKEDGFNSIFQRLTKEGNPVTVHVSPNNSYVLSHRVPTYRFTGGEINGVAEGMLELDQLSLPKELISHMDSQITSKMENSDSTNFTSPVGQLPFLEPYPESKILGPNWSVSDFTAGQSTTASIYKIYPTKGEVWAMYKKWNKKWKHVDYENGQFDVVEIMNDFSEGNGLMIARLTEVKGCLTFFHRQQYDGFDLTRAVSKPEVLGFSHRIPAFRVPGIGKHGIPESSWHLEPNALPYK